MGNIYLNSYTGVIFEKNSALNTMKNADIGKISILKLVYETEERLG